MPKIFILKTRIFHGRQDFRRGESGEGTSSNRFIKHVPNTLKLHKSCGPYSDPTSTTILH